MLKAIGGHELSKAGDRPSGLADLTEAMLGGDPPGSGRAEKDSVGLIADRRARRRTGVARR